LQDEFPDSSQQVKSAIFRANYEHGQSNRVGAVKTVHRDLLVVREWLDDCIEDQPEVSEELKAKIERAQTEIGQGIHCRVRTSEASQ